MRWITCIVRTILAVNTIAFIEIKEVNNELNSCCRQCFINRAVNRVMYTNYFLTVWFTYSSICSLGHQLFRSCVQSFVSLFKCATSTPLLQTRFPGRTTWRWWNWPGIYLWPRKIPESTSLSFLSAWIQHGHPRAPIAPCRAGVAPRKVRKPTDAHWLSACQCMFTDSKLLWLPSQHVKFIYDKNRV